MNTTALAEIPPEQLATTELTEYVPTSVYQKFTENLEWTENRWHHFVRTHRPELRRRGAIRRFHGRDFAHPTRMNKAILDLGDR